MASAEEWMKLSNHLHLTLIEHCARTILALKINKLAFYVQRLSQPCRLKIVLDEILKILNTLHFRFYPTELFSCLLVVLRATTYTFWAARVVGL